MNLCGNGVGEERRRKGHALRVSEKPATHCEATEVRSLDWNLPTVSLEDLEGTPLKSIQG